jgi:hypothetical protein
MMMVRNEIIIFYYAIILYPDQDTRETKEFVRFDYFSNPKLTIVSMNRIATSRSVFIVKLNGFIVIVTF